MTKHAELLRLLHSDQGPCFTFMCNAAAIHQSLHLFSVTLPSIHPSIRTLTSLTHSQTHMYLIQSRQTLAQLPIRVFHAALSLDPDSLHPGPILLKGYVYINCIDIWSLIRRPNFSVYWMMKKVTVEQSNNVFMCIVFYSVTSHSLCKIRRPPPLSTASLTQSSNMLQ